LRRLEYKSAQTHSLFVGNDSTAFEEVVRLCHLNCTKPLHHRTTREPYHIHPTNDTQHVSSTPSLSSIPTILTHSPTQPTTPMKLSALTVASAAFCFTHSVAAGPIGYGICQAGCAAVVMACYSAAGATWGATLGATAPASVLACNTAFGTCQAACAAVLLSPTP
jgi:hypothetical protein